MTGANDAVPGDVTQAVRDYLGAIEWLRDGRQAVTTQRVARHLGVSCPSVTNMIKRLHNRHLVSYEPYHGVRLTETGVAIAELAIRRRRLLERYLIEKLGYGVEGAHVEAIRLERAVTGAMEAHIEAALTAPLAISSGTPHFAAVGRTVGRPFIADDQQAKFARSPSERGSVLSLRRISSPRR